jgi:hypothetical protein
MNKRLSATATLIAASATAAGLFAGPSKSASSGCPKGIPGDPGCLVSLSATGPSPSTVRMPGSWQLEFRNTDSLTHTVVFANGCSFTLAPSKLRALGLYGGRCTSFSSYVGRYAYSVDGKFAGTVVTAPLRRFVTLTARTRTIRGGARLILHGQVLRNDQGHGLNDSLPVPVLVLARHSGKEPFERIATVRARLEGDVTNSTHEHAGYRWKLNVQPDATTTYIAKVTSQRWCWRPASRCAQPQGQLWTNPKSRPFTVRIRQGGPR